MKPKRVKTRNRMSGEVQMALCFHLLNLCPQLKNSTLKFFFENQYKVTLTRRHAKVARELVGKLPPPPRREKHKYVLTLLLLNPDLPAEVIRGNTILFFREGINNEDIQHFRRRVYDDPTFVRYQLGFPLKGAEIDLIHFISECQRGVEQERGFFDFDTVEDCELPEESEREDTSALDS